MNLPLRHIRETQVHILHFNLLPKNMNVIQNMLIYGFVRVENLATHIEKRRKCKGAWDVGEFWEMYEKYIQNFGR
jgi:hypothetical protein